MYTLFVLDSLLALNAEILLKLVLNTNQSTNLNFSNNKYLQVVIPNLCRIVNIVHD